MAKSFIFSSESVGEGHPDKVADYISDSVLDALLEQDPYSRVACETMVKSNCVFLSGEVQSFAKIDMEDVVRQAIQQIGYINDDDIFHANKVFISNYMTEQSPDIAQGVDARRASGKKTAEQGAGDQGIMFGYACDDTPELMPAAIVYAHKLNRELAKLRRTQRCNWLRPDCKSQVAFMFENGKPTELVNVVISTQHIEGVEHKQIEEFCLEEVIKKVIPSKYFNKETEYFINPTGKFVIGGPQSDAGLTGRKIIVDTYGGWGRHGGGAFSGKDPSKVDRSAAYMCRWVAKNLVAAGVAERVELQVAYAIGHPHPTSMAVETFGTGKFDEEQIIKGIQQTFSFKPADIISQLDLLRPIYRTTTNYGHFCKKELPWEDTSRSDELLDAIKHAK